MKHSFFISHSSTDKTIARRFQRAIESTGNAVWIDEQNLKYGTELLNSIEAGISEVTDFILLASDDSMKSKYVWEELHFARQRYSQGELAIYVVKITPEVILPVWLDKLIFLSIEGQDLKRRLGKFFMDATGVKVQDLLLEEMLSLFTRQSTGSFDEGYQAATGFYTSSLEAVRALIENVRVEEFEKFRGQILQLGFFAPRPETRSLSKWVNLAPGSFEMIFPTPMRVPPVIELNNLPENIEYRVEHVSNISARIQFIEKLSGLPTNDVPFLKLQGTLNSEL